MAEAQIIYQQQDPAAKMIADAGNSIADTIQKSQSLKLTGQYYKILAKNAETEQDKAKFERLSKLNSDILPQIAGTSDPATKSMLIKAVTDSGLYNGDTTQFLKDLNDSHEQVMGNHQSVTGSPYQSPQAQQGQPPQQQQPQNPGMQGPAYMSPGNLAAAQSNEANQSAMLNQARAYMLQHPEVGIQRAMQAMQAGQAANSQSAQGTQGSADGTPPGVPNSMQFSGMNINPATGEMQLQATNPAVDYLKANATGLGTNQAQRTAEMVPAQMAVNQYLGQLDKANQEVGGTSATTLGAIAKAKSGELASLVKPDSQVAVLKDMEGRMAIQLATAANHGRSNLQDVNMARESIPSLDQSRVTQQVLRQNLQNMVKVGLFDNKDPSKDVQVRQMLQQNKQIAGRDQQFTQMARSAGKTQSWIDQQLTRKHQEEGNL